MLRNRFQNRLTFPGDSLSARKLGVWILKTLLLAVALGLLFYAISALPSFGDWEFVYHDAGRSFADPYSVPGFLNTPWMAWILAPFALLPVHLSGAVWMTLAVVITIWCMVRLEANMLGIVLCLLSPAFIRYITSGQIDIVPILGFVLLITFEKIPYKGLGLILMSVKPQVLGGGALSYWLNLNRQNKFWVALPLLVVVIISFFIYGFWPLQIRPTDLARYVDFSPWPYGIPIGLFLLGWSIWKNRPILGGLATYFLVPYISPSSIFIYTAILFSRSPKWLIVAFFLFLWLFALLYT